MATARALARHVATARARPAALTFEAGMLLAATVLAAVVSVRAGGFSGDVVIALLAMGMGVRNAAVLRRRRGWRLRRRRAGPGSRPSAGTARWRTPAPRRG